MKLYNDLSKVPELNLKGRGDDWFWLNLTDPLPAQFKRLGKKLGIHGLAIEDSLEFGQRAKFDDYGDYGLLVFHGANGEGLEEVHFYIGKGGLVTVSKEIVPALEKAYGRLKDHPERYPFPLYELLDSLVDEFRPLLDGLSDQIDELENSIIESVSREQLTKVFNLKKEILHLRKTVSPERDLFSSRMDVILRLSGHDSEAQHGGTEGEAIDAEHYLRDVADSLIRISDLLNDYHDMASGCADLYLATQANKQGEISKQLTIVASICLPASVLTGLYGINFAYFDSHFLNHEWTWWIFGAAFPLLLAGGMVYWFKRRGWLKSSM